MLDPLVGGSTTEKYTWEKAKPLSHYLNYDGECIISCNGKIIDLTLNQIFPARNESYVIIPIPEGGDRETWRNVLSGAFATPLIASRLGMPVPPWMMAVSFIGLTLTQSLLRDKQK